MPDGNDSDKPSDSKAGKAENSWLMEFLLESGVSQYNPFEPTEKIQVKIGDQKEGKKTYH